MLDSGLSVSIASLLTVSAALGLLWITVPYERQEVAIEQVSSWLQWPE